MRYRYLRRDSDVSRVAVMLAQPKTRVRPAYIHLDDRSLLVTRRHRFAWRFRCESCGHESQAKSRAQAKLYEAAHREWHAHVQRASMAGPL